MAEITAAMVMKLRERTNIGMMDCKAALKETDGDFEEAVKFLKTKFKGKAEDKAGRVAAEGVVAVALIDGRDGAIIELNSETDFVARNEDFKSLAAELAHQVAHKKGETLDIVLTQDSAAQPGVIVKDRINDIFSKLRENIVFKRFELLSTGPNGAISAYVHIPSNDKIGVLVELETGSPEAAKSDAIQNLGREIAMQIAALRPKFLSRDEVPAKTLADEREIAATQAKNEGKPEAAVEKIVEGRVRKFYEENVLLDQAWLREPKKSVAQVIKEAGEGVVLKKYVRYEIGQGTGADSSGDIKAQAE